MFISPLKNSPLSEKLTRPINLSTRLFTPDLKRVKFALLEQETKRC